jgi:hypothetical protein
MPRAVVGKKGKLKKIVPPITMIPGGGNDVYEGNKLIMTDTMRPSRKLTRKEANFMAKKLELFAKKKGITVIRR